MTVSTTITKHVYNGNDLTTLWDFTFLAYDEDHISVYITDTDSVVTKLSTGYTVDLINSQVEYPASGSGLPVLATGEKITIARELDLIQELDLTRRGPFDPETLEQNFDYFLMMIQQLQEQLTRTIRYAIDQTPTETETTGFLEAIEAARDAAAASQAAASASAVAAALSETNAGVSETNASASEIAAALSETNAAASELAAGNSETAAALSEANAGASETAAAASEAAALASENAAALSEGNAATSETNAAASEAAALAAQTAAEAARDAAQAFAESIMQSGFVDRTDSLVTYNDATREVSIQPTGIDYDIWSGGSIFTKSGIDTVQIPDVEGRYFFYFNESGVLSYLSAFDNLLITYYAYISAAYWDATNKKFIKGLRGEERHGVEMDSVTHQYLHNTRSTVYQEGLALNSIVADGNGSLDAHATFGIDTGIIWDEDLRHVLSAVTNGDNVVPLIYREGASNWRGDNPTGFCVKPFTGGSGRLAYNQFTGGVWQQTELGQNKYVLAHIYALKEFEYDFIALQGQNVYGSLQAAREGANVEVESINTEGLPAEEWKLIATLIFQTSTTYSNSVKARIRSTADGADYVDWRTVDSRLPLSHGTLSGLDDDSHLQYQRNPVPVALTTGTETVTADQVRNTIYLCDTSGGNIIIDLPDASTFDLDTQNFMVLKTNSANSVTINPFGAQTINGASSYVLSSLYEFASFVRNGSNWVLSNVNNRNQINLDTINEFTAANGVAIDSILIKDGKFFAGVNGDAANAVFARQGDENTGLFFEADKLWLGAGGNGIAYAQTTDGFKINLVGLKVPNAASADANTLDWYEEGEIATVEIYPATSGSITMNANARGDYTRIGNMVFFYMSLPWDSISSPNGVIRVRTLPFTPNARNLSGCAFYNIQGLTFTKQFIGQIVGGATYIRLRDENVAFIDQADLASTGLIALSGVYYI